MDTTTDTAPAMEEPVAMPVGPSISSVTVADITHNSARIDINSDELVQGYVEYGTSEQYGMSTPLTSEFSTSPSFLLENLSSETLYHFRVIAMDSAGNVTITSDETFTTLATPTSPPPTTATTTSSGTGTTTPTTATTTTTTTDSSTPPSSLSTRFPLLQQLFLGQLRNQPHRIFNMARQPHTLFLSATTKG
jgi:hypothetical protein